MDDEQLFYLALERPAGERPAFLDGACAGDAAMRRRLEVLLDEGTRLVVLRRPWGTG